MKLGVLTSLNNNVEANIKAVKDYGFDTCQLKCWSSSFLTDEYAARAKAAAEEYGVTITGFWAGWDGVAVWNFYEGPSTLGIVPKEYRSERIKFLIKASDIANKMNVKDIITHVGFIPENPATTEYLELVTAIRYLAKILLKREQFFLFETGQETPVTLKRMIQDVGTGNLGINLDPANLIMYGKANAVDSLHVFGEYVRGVHAKDGLYPTDGKSLGHETPLGEGRVDFPRFVQTLKDLGYTGALTIEREISGEQQIIDIKNAKEYLENLLGQ